MDHLQTEARNPLSVALDRLSSLELVALMNAEDGRVIPAVAAEAAHIARAIEVIADRLGRGGRLIYIGAGTSGRLGVLDATECPPTFSAVPGQVVGVIAGGMTALTQAVEGAEDRPELAEQDLRALNVGPKDVVVGIATSGRTPYVQGGVQYARRCGAFAIGLSCNADSDLLPLVDLAITPVVGPEVLTGSTRLKAGTATKLVLNMLSTGAMVRLGKTYGNLMVDLRASNTKLRARTNRIVRQLTGLDQEHADQLLERCGGELKTALVAQLSGTTPERARQSLHEAGGRVAQALQHAAPASTERVPDLLLGIDGGGTRTVALLARPDPASGSVTFLGRGTAGPSNLRTVGMTRAMQSVEEAVAGAFADAHLPRQTVAVVSLGLAGVGRAEEQRMVETWGTQAKLGEVVIAGSDVSLVLAAGTPKGWGLALIAGTGSIAFARSAEGNTTRAGGWGPLLGDEGSGYSLVLAGLRAAVRAADGRGPATELLPRFLERMGLPGAQGLIAAIYGDEWDRQALAALAPLVLEVAAAGDLIASTIVKHQADELVAAAFAVLTRLGLNTQPVPVALAGGLLLGSARFRDLVLDSFTAFDIRPESVVLVDEPARGAVRLALARSR